MPQTLAEKIGLSLEQAKQVYDLAFELKNAGAFEGAMTLLEGLVVLNPKDTFARAALDSLRLDSGQALRLSTHN